MRRGILETEVLPVVCEEVDGCAPGRYEGRGVLGCERTWFGGGFGEKGVE